MLKLVIIFEGHHSCFILVSLLICKFRQTLVLVEDKVFWTDWIFIYTTFLVKMLLCMILWMYLFISSLINRPQWVHFYAAKCHIGFSLCSTHVPHTHIPHTITHFKSRVNASRGTVVRMASLQDPTQWEMIPL